MQPADARVFSAVRRFRGRVWFGGQGFKSIRIGDILGRTLGDTLAILLSFQCSVFRVQCLRSSARTSDGSEPGFLPLGKGRSGGVVLRTRMFLLCNDARHRWRLVDTPPRSPLSNGGKAGAASPRQRLLPGGRFFVGWPFCRWESNAKLKPRERSPPSSALWAPSPPEGEKVVNEAVFRMVSGTVFGFPCLDWGRRAIVTLVRGVCKGRWEGKCNRPSHRAGMQSLQLEC